jgi:hypothetical protein
MRTYFLFHVLDWVMGYKKCLSCEHDCTLNVNLLWNENYQRLQNTK